MSKKSKKYNLPSIHIMRKASNGDIEAINTVLKHYEAYIETLPVRKLYDEYGQVHYCIGEHYEEGWKQS